MATTRNKVMWQEGMLMRPHHFQQQQVTTTTWITSVSGP